MRLIRSFSIRPSLVYFLPAILVYLAPVTAESQNSAALIEENNAIAEDSKKVLDLYKLDPGEKWRDITQEVLNTSETSPNARESIVKYRRRIVLFTYPSDGLQIKGFFSYTPNPEMHPLLILFRWGNRNFALMNPGLGLATYGDYTVISSTLRGGVSEGTDEFGGADVRDMKSLMDYIPTLAKELGIRIHPHCTFMMGPSRGGMEMFLTLSRYPELQNQVTKIVALSSILDLHTQIRDRPDDMKKMFETSFGLNAHNEEQWISSRDPLQTITKIKKTLPILIVQGTDDPRINLQEGYRMRDALKESGHNVSYWEAKGGNHTLSNFPTAMDTIGKWLEFNAHCNR